MLTDMGVKVETPVRVMMDASAGLGVMNRRGAGRIRHIHTPALWLQRARQDVLVVTGKVEGTDNVADLGTKFLDAQLIGKFLTECDFVKLRGRSHIALKASVDALDMFDKFDNTVNGWGLNPESADDECRMARDRRRAASCRVSDRDDPKEERESVSAENEKRMKRRRRARRPARTYCRESTSPKWRPLVAIRHYH